MIILILIIAAAMFVTLWAAMKAASQGDRQMDEIFKGLPRTASGPRSQQ